MNYLLNNNWNLWYHSLKDNNWDKKSYSKLITIRNLFDYKLIEDEFKQNHYQNGMFFLMKEDIFPNWEDPNNRLGGCLSFKIPSSELISSWNTLFQSCICEMILKGNNEEINGISIAPKKEFNIIKIWIKDNSFNYKDYFNELNNYFTLKECLYKKHDFN